MLSVKDIHDMTSRAVLANCNNLTRHPSANVVWMWSLLLIVNWYGAVFYVFYFPESSSNRHHHSAGMRKCCTINLKKLGVSIHSQLATYVKSTSHTDVNTAPHTLIIYLRLRFRRCRRLGGWGGCVCGRAADVVNDALGVPGCDSSWSSLPLASCRTAATQWLWRRANVCSLLEQSSWQTVSKWDAQVSNYYISHRKWRINIAWWWLLQTY